MSLVLQLRKQKSDFLKMLFLMFIKLAVIFLIIYQMIKLFTRIHLLLVGLQRLMVMRIHLKEL